MTISNVAQAAVIGVVVAGGWLVAAPLAAVPPGGGQTTVTSGSVRLLDKATDSPAPPNDPNEVCRFNTVRVACPPVSQAPEGSLFPPGAVWPPGAVELPGTGLPMPPLPPGVELPPEVPQMLQQAMEMLRSPPPNVPNEVCRFNTIRVPCP
jgi:hypothetical protein